MKARLVLTILALAPFITAFANPPAATPAPRPSEGNPEFSVFMMQELQPMQTMLVNAIKQCIMKGDYTTMETICRKAVSIFSKDGTWHYNLACALARLGKRDEALDMLEKAVGFGYLDVKGMSADNDLATLRRDRRFKKIMAKATYIDQHPELNPNMARPVILSDRLEISEKNTIWNMNTGGYMTLVMPPKTTAPTTDTNLFVKLPGKAGEMLRKWQKEGTAAGNLGDIYDNHDNGHSTLDTRLFPELANTFYSPEAKKYGISTGLSLFTFSMLPTIGNSSTAYLSGPIWRSRAREALVGYPHLLFMQYLANTIYVYPQHHDYRADKHNDVFFSRSPYCFISPASSWSDKAILVELAGALAALRPETKVALVQSRSLAPALHYLMHASLKSVVKREDYLKPQAHPVLFDGGAVDTVKLFELAHSLTPSNLPPMPVIRVIAEKPTGRPGYGFFDLSSGERFCDTPAMVARVFRNMEYSRAIRLSADASRDFTGRPLKYHWILLQGDPQKTRIKPLDPDGKAVEIEIDYQGPLFDTPYHMKSSRVDIALIVDNGTHYSPPAFFTYFFLNNEIRCYSADKKRILSVDYASAAGNYVDPHISLTKDWKDVYSYDKNGNLTGWTRFRKGQPDGTAYLPNGFRVLRFDANGQPGEMIPVDYKRELSPDGSRMYLEEHAASNNATE